MSHLTTTFSQTPPLDSWIDIPFNIYLTLILLLIYTLILHSRLTLLLIVILSTSLILTFDTTSTSSETIKLLAELPLGLGSVLLFLVSSRDFKKRHLSAFTIYVNLAVYGNIGMMVFTPSGRTFRGACTKITCFTLFIWILQQGYHARWKTIVSNDGLFIFTAVSKAWILAHAIYRFVLLTLPCFGSGRRHRLLEVYSLTMTWALARRKGLGFEMCFGMADTLVVPATAAWSAIATTFELVEPSQKGDGRRDVLGKRVDLGLGVLVLGVAVFACFQIITAARGGSRGVGR